MVPMVLSLDLRRTSWSFRGTRLGLPWVSRGFPAGLPRHPDGMTTLGTPLYPTRCRLFQYCTSPLPLPLSDVTPPPLDQVDLQPNSLGSPPEEVLQVLKYETPPTVVSCCYY